MVASSFAESNNVASVMLYFFAENFSLERVEWYVALMFKLIFHIFILTFLIYAYPKGVLRSISSITCASVFPAFAARILSRLRVEGNRRVDAVAVSFLRMIIA